MAKGKNQIYVAGGVGHLIVGDQTILIDVEDVERVSNHSWCLSKCSETVYRPMSRIKGKGVLLHRFLMDAKPGDIVDHISRDIKDNRKENLRIVTKAENAHNTKVSKNNQHGYRGVTRSKTGRGFIAQIAENNTCHYLGTYSTVQDAARAYDRGKLFYHPSAPRGAFNFPSEVSLFS